MASSSPAVGSLPPSSRRGKGCLLTPYIKRVPQEERTRNSHQEKGESSQVGALPLPSGASLLPPCAGAPAGASTEEERDLRQPHTVVLLDLRVRRIYFRNSAGSGKGKKSSSTACVRSLRGVEVSHVRHSSSSCSATRLRHRRRHHRAVRLHDPEVGDNIVFIDNACAGA